jgi:DNA repair ATPase RecN
LNKSISQNKTWLEKYNSELKTTQSLISEERRKLTKAKEKAKFLFAQAELLEYNANEINATKLKLYDIGPVPPSYRTLDAVVMIYSIFMNDQADTMREATLLYDTRVYRGEVVTGIHNIYKMLGNLSRSMQSIESVLIEIRNSVNVMSTEMYLITDKLQKINTNISKTAEIYENQSDRLSSIAHKQMEKINEHMKEQGLYTSMYMQELITENKATRSAIEHLNFSNSKYDWYIEQYRQGLL